MTPDLVTPSGVIDGANATFTLAATPSVLILIRNGVVLREGTGYSLAGATITFLSGYIPQVGDLVRAVTWP